MADRNYIELKSSDTYKYREATTAEDWATGSTLGVGPDGKFYAISSAPKGAVEATPAAPVVIKPTSTATKIATKDIILGDEQVPIELMTDLIFENIGGQEIINILRNDLLNGQEFLYNPIKNINKIYAQNNSKNMVALQNTMDSYFKNYAIDLISKIPEVGNGTDGSNVYLDTTTGNVVIDLVNMQKDEQVDIQILIDGDLLDGTIY